VYFVLELIKIVAYLRNNIHIPQFDRQFQERYATLQITRVGTLIVATIYLQLIQNRYMFRSFTVLQC